MGRRISVDCWVEQGESGGRAWLDSNRPGKVESPGAVGADWRWVGPGVPVEKVLVSGLEADGFLDGKQTVLEMGNGLNSPGGGGQEGLLDRRKKGSVEGGLPDGDF